MPRRSEQERINGIAQQVAEATKQLKHGESLIVERHKPRDASSALVTMTVKKFMPC